MRQSPTASMGDFAGSGAPPDLAELIGRHIPGHALERVFYTDAGIFELDLARMLLQHWFCAGHVSSVPHRGDFLVADLGSESVIIVRTAADDIRALVNVCRHRGSRIGAVPLGHAAAGRLTCPYHAWSYDLEGHLLTAREMPQSFDRARHSLKPLPIRVVEGLIFTTFAAEPPDFTTAAAALSQSAGVHGWARAKVAHRETYGMRANWKLALENYMECYHCQPAHPEFAKQHVLARPAAQSRHLEEAGRSRAEALGVFIEDLDQYGSAALPGSEAVSVHRSTLVGTVNASAGADPPRRAPLMGGFAADDGNTTYFDIGPLSDFLAYADHGVIYRFIPRAVQHTELEVLWLVHEDAREGEDYDVETLTSLWRTTSLEDKTIVELNQAGVNSRFFEPGPYSLLESYARRFVDWYLAEIGAPLFSTPCGTGSIRG